MLHRLKQLVPTRWLRPYHYLMAQGAAFVYRYPSNKMRVIGVTGSNGKSSTTQLIGQLLMALGETVGWTTTDSFRIADKVIANRQKMTMLGRTRTHKMMREMRVQGCTYAVIETSSQGIDQYRHIGINYDVGVFTNLIPTHVEAHGGFENYKAAKRKLFEVVARSSRKRLNGKRVEKLVVVNANSEHAPTMAAVPADRVVAFAREDQELYEVGADDVYEASEITHDPRGTQARVRGGELALPLVGAYYFENTLAAITTVVSLGFPLEDVLEAAKQLTPIPGRLEQFEHAGAHIIVDYAPEPYSLMALYEVVALFSPKRVIHVTGSTGGGRDVAARAEIGKLAHKHDDVVIVTNEDPYDDDPMEIINDVAQGAADVGMVDGETLFRILDRQEAIQKAVDLAAPGDVVIITGKGSEPVMAVANGKKVPWDDREAVRKAIAYAERTA